MYLKSFLCLTAFIFCCVGLELFPRTGRAPSRRACVGPPASRNPKAFLILLTSNPSSTELICLASLLLRLTLRDDAAFCNFRVFQMSVLGRWWQTSRVGWIFGVYWFSFLNVVFVISKTETQYCCQVDLADSSIVLLLCLIVIYGRANYTRKKSQYLQKSGKTIAAGQLIILFCWAVCSKINCIEAKNHKLQKIA